MTICVTLKDLAEPGDALRIASIVTGHSPKSSYIVVEAETEPRRELADAANLLSLMVLVSALEKSGCKTLVSHCASEMMLMKVAGASDCASGKYFSAASRAAASMRRKRVGADNSPIGSSTD